MLSLFSCSVVSDCFVTLWTVARQARQSMGILQARILEWVAISFSRGYSRPRIKPRSPAVAGRFFTTEPREDIKKNIWLNHCCAETDSDIETRSVVFKRVQGEGMDWEFGISRCKLLYIEWINMLCVAWGTILNIL